MTTALQNFYVTGGTLPRGAPSYVPRQADSDLLEELQRGQYCYILTCRQMGKSSLMVRAAAHLRQDGVACVVLDLTALGQNLTPEQWYDGLLNLIGPQLDLEQELEAFWLSHTHLSPLHRWTRAVQEVVLARVPGKIVFFVDEIDAVRSLPFCADEFFAAIREFYNRRAESPEFERLTFCLQGVATPSDLIRDTRTTPFNIGRRIELTDFTEAEAIVLTQGFGCDRQTGDRLLRRILYWTGGHPYLTQRLCRGVAERLGAGGARWAAPVSPPLQGLRTQDVDHVCEELFLSGRAAERDDNLLFVRDRLLRSEMDVAGLLGLYARVRAGRRVGDSQTNPLVSTLKLSGIVQVVRGFLKVRNPIYARVFDREWIRDNLPQAEVLRQQAAYRRGVLRAALVSSAIVITMAALAITAVVNARLAGRTARAEGVQRHLAEDRGHLAEEQALTARRYLYVADMALAQTAYHSGESPRAMELLAESRPEAGQKEDVRGWEWRYLWSACHNRIRLVLANHYSPVIYVAFSPGSKTLVTGSENSVRCWDLWKEKEGAAFQAAPAADVRCVATSPDAMSVAMGRAGGEVDMWVISANAASPLFCTLDTAVVFRKEHRGGVACVAFAPDGRTLASGGDDATIRLWRLGQVTFTPDGRTLASGRDNATVVLRGHAGRVACVAFSPDGRTLATGGVDGTVRLWNPASRKQMALLKGHAGAVLCVSFSPDGTSLASGSTDGTIKLWSVVRRQAIASLKGHQRSVRCVAFSPNGRILASASEDQSVELWDLARRREQRTFLAHPGSVNSVAFSPDGTLLATGGADGTARLWSLTAAPEVAVLHAHTQPARAVAFSRDGKILASGGDDNRIRVWDVGFRNRAATLSGHTGSIRSVALSPNGRLLVSESADGTARLWDLRTRREIARFLIAPDATGRAIAISPDASMLAIAERKARFTSYQPILLWDVNARRTVDTIHAPTGGSPGLAFSPDGKTLAVCESSLMPVVTLWDVPTREPAAALMDQSSLRTTGDGAATLMDQSSLRTTTGDGVVVEISSPVSGFYETASSRICLEFSPDGKMLACGGGDRSIRVWDVATRERLATLHSRFGAVDLAFSPDGRTLAAAHEKEGIQLWNLPAQREVIALEGRPGLGFWSVKFSGDNTTLAAACADGSVWLWHADPFTQTDSQVGVYPFVKMVHGN